MLLHIQMGSFIVFLFKQDLFNVFYSLMQNKRANYSKLLYSCGTEGRNPIFLNVIQPQAQ